jgi:hypothetical protein
MESHTCILTRNYKLAKQIVRNSFSQLRIAADALGLSYHFKVLRIHVSEAS